jgi:predicted amino acid dehydrogenase
LSLPALRLPGSELYGCLAEAIVLGLAGHAGHYSYGPLSAARVRQVRGWALQHGFEISAA